MDFVPSDINSKKDLRKNTKIQEEDSTNDPLSGREDFFSYEFIPNEKIIFPNLVFVNTKLRASICGQMSLRIA